jgi:hypothetical protein
MESWEMVFAGAQDLFPVMLTFAKKHLPLSM